MSKEFIAYEQALALKELGFDEPCMAYYDLAQDFQFPCVTMVNRNFAKLKTVMTPIYQQAFRWFREKHDLYHVITIADLGKYETGNPDFQCAIYSKDPVLITNMNKYNTYEEAELACLKQLIKIVKEKK